ncbi:MAG: HPr family phosphocarrier protein [Eubacteriales bacterium]|nr:HPr family phosphocarrier protein [Eubacteriales bacterium]
MRNVVISANQSVWDDFQIVKLVNKAGSYNCNINIVSGKKYINVKNIKNMMEFFGNFRFDKEVKIALDGDQEEEIEGWLADYFK